jgi:hypothetical protein
VFLSGSLSAITSLNGLTGATQTFASSSSGTDCFIKCENFGGCNGIPCTSYEYKIKNSSPVYSECVNNYMKIPIVFKELQNNNFSKDIYGMYLVVWNPYCETSIHNHPEGGCLMKILEGSITQHKFRSNEMLTETQELHKNDICYINDNIGLHRISNNNMNYSYSLHLYSPALLDSEVNNKTFKSKSTLLLPESKINHCLLAAK